MDLVEFKYTVCCGIVLYNPDIDELLKNVSIVSKQVDAIVLVDNNSTNIDEIRKIFKTLDSKIHLVQNPKNLGIAEALNQILKFALDNNYRWYMTLDQDSTPDSNMINCYHEVLINENILNVGGLTPVVLNNGKQTMSSFRDSHPSLIESVYDPVDCITSGMLVNTQRAQRCGGYDAQLFIDCVDVEFNIRLFVHKFAIYRVNTTYLLQKMGQGKTVLVFKVLARLTKKNFFKSLSVTPVYNEARLYYICRNSRFLRMKYGRSCGNRMHASVIILQMGYYLLTFPLSRNRFQMLKAMFKGWKDAKYMEGYGQ